MAAHNRHVLLRGHSMTGAVVLSVWAVQLDLARSPSFSGLRWHPVLAMGIGPPRSWRSR
ncbi:hypothetical protein [Aeromicrobium wangtongii]|uniref:Uncharacterized protein n=1 Tax=Aeromicrobium wangtongii TaxID=2969247 RepID=A0ABY5M4W5_9ACTN|nr:hypothetical protein [Aeromicrobium wangtongii]MCD9197989.1 hypothetical protein [Aeromicrobium wangtongii]UUP12033.1 hypothetical protein NQV15_09170 [Aeromicrobium wangtongii]